MLFTENIKVKGVFKIEKFTDDGTIIYSGEEFDNMVLNNGLLQIAEIDYPKEFLNFVNLGSSNVPVDPAQTGLQARMYSTENSYNNLNWARYTQ